MPSFEELKAALSKAQDRVAQLTQFPWRLLASRQSKVNALEALIDAQLALNADQPNIKDITLSQREGYQGYFNQFFTKQDLADPQVKALQTRLALEKPENTEIENLAFAQLKLQKAIQSFKRYFRSESDQKALKNELKNVETRLDDLLKMPAQAEVVPPALSIPDIPKRPPNKRPPNKVNSHLKQQQEPAQAKAKIFDFSLTPLHQLGFNTSRKNGDTFYTYGQFIEIKRDPTKEPPYSDETLSNLVSKMKPISNNTSEMARPRFIRIQNKVFLQVDSNSLGLSWDLEQFKAKPESAEAGKNKVLELHMNTIFTNSAQIPEAKPVPALPMPSLEKHKIRKPILSSTKNDQISYDDSPSSDNSSPKLR